MLSVPFCSFQSQTHGASFCSFALGPRIPFGCPALHLRVIVQLTRVTIGYSYRARGLSNETRIVIASGYNRGVGKKPLQMFRNFFPGIEGTRPPFSRKTKFTLKSLGQLVYPWMKGQDCRHQIIGDV